MLLIAGSENMANSLRHVGQVTNHPRSS